jgi:formylglycine-generating enzyme required for sulfatase activity/tRNA A-37 threonylcarbamoyl transferase component Bud32
VVTRIGSFEIVEELGRGAMGVVFRAFDPAIGRPIAIKVIRAQAFATNEEDQEARLRFAHEAAAAGRLSHPNIVTVFHFGEERDYQYLVMELVEGKALNHVGPEKCLPILRQLAGALDYAHTRGVVHRDIKPANVLVGADGQIKLTDFGIARLSSQTITQTGMTMGTPWYMAPEQVMSSRVDGKADQFSLAVIAFELLTGRKPFEGPTSQAVMFAIVQADRPAAHEVNPAMPPAISEVLRRAMAKEPANRFPTCLEFVKALEMGLMPPAPQVPVEPAPGPPVTRAPVPRFRLAIVAASAVLGTVLLAMAYAFVSHNSGNPAQQRITKVNPKDNLQYVWIPPGSFRMGCSPSDTCFIDEKPAHEVEITKGFWLGQTAVTQEAYQHVVGTNPSYFKGSDLPVETVSWYEARIYCEAIGGRLPTEAEWEYAARAGSTSARYGNLDGIAWYSANSQGRTHSVRQKQPNSWGLYDMLGNVWQWTADWNGLYWTPNWWGGTQHDPSGPNTGSNRIMRGGGWDEDRRTTSVSVREPYRPEFRNHELGFRCVGE